MNVSPINQNEQWMSLVLFLKETAKEKKITQEEISNITGLKQSAISRMLSLKFKPTIDSFCKICNALEIKTLNL